MKRKILTVLVIFILGKAVAQVDSTSVKPKTNLLKKSLVPLSLIGAGILLSDSGFEKSFNTSSRNWIGNDFETNLDDYTRYAPVATIFMADVTGVQAKNHWFDQTKNLAISMILTDVFTRALKKIFTNLDLMALMKMLSPLGILPSPLPLVLSFMKNIKTLVHS